MRERNREEKKERKKRDARFEVRGNTYYNEIEDPDRIIDRRRVPRVLHLPREETVGERMRREAAAGTVSSPCASVSDSTMLGRSGANRSL